MGSRGPVRASAQGNLTSCTRWPLTGPFLTFLWPLSLMVRTGTRPHPSSRGTVGPVNCCWPSPAHSLFMVPSPAGLYHTLLSHDSGSRATLDSSPWVCWPKTYRVYSEVAVFRIQKSWVMASDVMSCVREESSVVERVRGDWRELYWVVKCNTL
jgi:hypothetical protein